MKSLPGAGYQELATRSWLYSSDRYSKDLGCASYVVADEGEAAVVDLDWDNEEYLRLANEHNFRISHILEMHNPTDRFSGRGRLATATGTTIHISKDAGVEYEHEPLADGDRSGPAADRGVSH
jgi:hydroxyacylglutathione hydrolase